ncbi:MAG: hypothetical protein U5K79_01970 [Cyclobacteriaceae bacterium]|nr:hypothetical protein [Cyclobacteriaceae bacterium]
MSARFEEWIPDDDVVVLVSVYFRNNIEKSTWHYHKQSYEHKFYYRRIRETHRGRFD